MKTLFVKSFSIILTLTLLVTMCPVTSVFAEDIEFGEVLRYAEFTLSTNAPTRTYATAKYGSQSISILSWADGKFTANTNHKIRMEADSRPDSLSNGEAAKVKVFVDDVLKGEISAASPSENLSLALMAYKTPTITISNPEYGCIDCDGNKTVWLNSFQKSSDGSSEEVLFNGDEIYDESGAEFQIIRDTANAGNSTVLKYDGSKLSYHGKDSANNSNSAITLSFGKLTGSGEIEIPDEPNEPTTPSDIYNSHIAKLIETESASYGFEDISSAPSNNSFFEGMMFADSGGELSIENLSDESYTDGKVLKFDTSAMVDGSPRMVFRNRNGYEIVEFAFDFMVENISLDRKINIKMNTGWIGDGISIGKSGNVSGFGSGVSYSAKIEEGKWHTIRMLYDCNADKFIFMLDDTVIYDLTCDVDYTFADYMEFLSGSGVMYFDNLSAKSYMSRPGIARITSGIDTAEITMDTPVQTTERIDGKLETIDFLPLFSITQNGRSIEIVSVEYVESQKKFIVTAAAPFESSLKYTVTLSEEIRSIAGAAVSPDTKADFVTPMSDFDVTKTDIKNGKISATIVNNTDEEKTASMAIVCRDADGSYIDSHWALSQPIPSGSSKLVLDISDHNAENYEIVFADSNDTCIPIKNHIYGTHNISAPDYKATGGEFVSAAFDVENFCITVSGKTSVKKGSVAIITLAPYDESFDADLPFSDDNPPTLTAFAICGENGSLNQIIDLPSDFESRKYSVFVTTTDDIMNTDVTIGSKTDADELTNMCNEENSPERLSKYMSESNSFSLMGIDAADAEKYALKIANNLIALRPSSGYTYAQICKGAKLTLLKQKITSGESADDVMKKYCDSLGITYSAYMALPQEVRTEIEKIIKDPNTALEKISFDDLSLIAQIRVASASWSELKEIMTSNCDQIGIDTSSGSTYSKLSSQNKAQVFKNIRQDTANAVSLGQIANLFEDEVDKLYRKSQKETSSSGGGGGGGGGGITPIKTIIADTPQSAEPINNEFTDISGHFAQDAIKFLVAKKIISGYPDNTFRPDNEVTRAEFSKLIAVAFDIKANEAKSFDDVYDTDWYHDPICALASNGIIMGDGQKFYPLNNITREDAAVILYRVLSAKTDIKDSELLFEDSDEISEYASKSIGAMSNAGIILGSNNCFYPKNPITRGEAAILIYRAFNISEEVAK